MDQAKTSLLKSLLQRFAGTALLFGALVGVGVSLVLLLASCVGYLPYSDRPGPGWWGRVHWPSWPEFMNYSEFAPWFAYFCFYFGLGLFALCLLLGIASTPRWLNRIIGGVIATMAAGLAVMGAGWYFALAAIGPDAAMVLGLVYGVFVFPSFVKPRTNSLPLWTRIGAVACSVGLFAYCMISPLLPKKPIPSVNYDLVRVTPGSKALVVASFKRPDIANGVAGLKLRGGTHGGISGAAGSEQSVAEIDVELIALEPITKETQLAIPKTGCVVYVLQNGTWKAQPSISETDKRRLLVGPGDDTKYDGGRLRLSNEKYSHSFTWYPTILKGQ